MYVGIYFTIVHTNSYIYVLTCILRAGYLSLFTQFHLVPLSLVLFVLSLPILVTLCDE